MHNFRKYKEKKRKYFLFIYFFIIESIKCQNICPAYFQKSAVQTKRLNKKSTFKYFFVSIIAMDKQLKSVLFHTVSLSYLQFCVVPSKRISERTIQNILEKVTQRDL